MSSAVNILGQDIKFNNDLQVKDIFFQLSQEEIFENKDFNFKKVVALKINNNLYDIYSAIVIKDNIDNIELITLDSQEGLDILRHSTAHILAQAAKRIYGDAIQITMGPVTENGFYYDFAIDGGLSKDDLKKIEKEMKKIVKENLTIERLDMPRDEAIKFFENLKENYKVEVIKDIAQGDILSLYKQGDFVDLCRGPHLPRTGLLKAFKLTKLAGAYWRGNSENAMLQRVYGTAFATKEDLALYLKRIEEAEKRDHRKIGKALDLFHLQEESPGMVFWHPNGYKIYQAVIQYMRKIWQDNGYQEISTPEIVDRSLWEKSGHWDKFLNEMYTTNIDDRVFAVKPMNCPCHIQVYKHGLKSYKDLPLRLAEFGCCHRKEPSGTLHGLMRVREFIQDDAHIFCSKEQIAEEVIKFNNLVFKVYKDFGFEDVAVKFSTRPNMRVGSDELWDEAEATLEKVLNDSQVDWELQEGEGAFYGPKIEYAFKDCLDRVWQLGTLQLDFSMPERLEANYINKEGLKETPVMLHRAIFGSVERFIGILIEHYAGELPVWLTPVQIAIINISDKHEDYAKKVYDSLQKYGIRSNLDLRNEKMNLKIREHTLQKVPYIAIIGDKELADGTVSIRKRDGENLGAMTCEGVVDLIEKSQRVNLS